MSSTDEPSENEDPRPLTPQIQRFLVLLERNLFEVHRKEEAQALARRFQLQKDVDERRN